MFTVPRVQVAFRTLIWLTDALGGYDAARQ